MQEITLKELLEAGCHFGHKAERWHPKAAEFIYQERDGIHVIDLAKTKAGLERAAAILKKMGEEGQIPLFVGTKRQAAPIVKAEAERVGAPYFCKRWIGGFLTNWSEVHKNLEKIRRLTEEQETGAWNKFPKHERVKLSRYLGRLNMFYGGVSHLTQAPDAVVVVDIRREDVAVAEGRKMGKVLIGIVDTNSDPNEVEYYIPSNDDAVGALQLLIKVLADSYAEGVEIRGKGEAAKKEAEAKSLQVPKETSKPEKEAGTEKKQTNKEKATESVPKKVIRQPADHPEASPAEGLQMKSEQLEKKVKAKKQSKAKKL